MPMESMRPHAIVPAPGKLGSANDNNLAQGPGGGCRRSRCGLLSRIQGDRGGELADAIAQGVASVAERAGRITGYATPVAYFGHAVAETNDDLKALIAAAPAFPGPGFLLPARNGDMMRWCLAEGLRVVQTMTLMTIGLYNEPKGAWLPSVLN